MKKSILTIGLFSLVMVLTFTTPETNIWWKSTGGNMKLDIIEETTGGNMKLYH
jgi:hypothetical protein